MAKTISVYFNGTDDNNDVPDVGVITLAALLNEITVKDENNISICLTGCGIDNSIIVI
ncbi:MAG: hypothetical protein H0W64_06950 [Gammaproteobacteria bacterium]|nr:hypothetical protein [Gammaproteobacteria bacterium]